MDFWRSSYLDEGKITFVLLLTSQALLRRRRLQIPYIHTPPHTHSHTGTQHVHTHTCAQCRLSDGGGILEY